MTEDIEAVAAANDRFYRAFESLTLAEMERVWAHDESVTCVHPGRPRLSGWPAVRDAWATIFAHTAEIRFTITGLQVEVRGDLAWVSCTENILTENRGRLSVVAVLATNVFERQGSRWLVVHHHASHVLTPPGTPAA